NAFTRDGYTFGGWNTAENGSGTAYADSASVENLTNENGATVTLYAQWEQSLYSCDPGYYWNGTQCVECAGSKYYCPGVTNAVYGTPQGQVACPTVMDPYGGVTFVGGGDYGQEGVRDSVNDCSAAIYYVPKNMSTNLFGLSEEELEAFGYNPDADANKRGVMSAICYYDASTQQYTKNCLGSVSMCLGGYYTTAVWDSVETLAIFETDTLAQMVDTYCIKVGSGYYSPSASGTPSDQVRLNSLKRNQCPVSTDGRLVESPEGADSADDCYVTCPTSIDIDNGTTTVIDETPNYPSYTCKYNAECDTGYHVNNQGTAAPSCSINTYTVYMYGNGGYIDGYISQVTQERTYDDGVKLTANTFTRGGYTFAGWNTSADGSGTSYADGTT
ncbi:MAG: InlB B-repeat-containing protein, partial [Alphaproteobacteria bacterium]|nr:InlB B-repeat-containing protein [Alphaproteobacteria bacterium]